MTRERERDIRKEAISYLEDLQGKTFNSVSESQCFQIYAFEAGAAWADQHPHNPTGNDKILETFNKKKKMKKVTIEIPDDCEIEKMQHGDNEAIITFKKKEPKLPKSWDEFCEMYMVSNDESWIGETSEIEKYNNYESRYADLDRNVLPDRATAEAVLALCQLIQLRNAYNGDWVPDWKEDKIIHFIEFCNEGIQENEIFYRQSSPLYFKTKELLDEFLRNFRPLIDKLKPLYGIKLDSQQ